MTRPAPRRWSGALAVEPGPLVEGLGAGAQSVDDVVVEVGQGHVVLAAALDSGAPEVAGPYA